MHPDCSTDGAGCPDCGFGPCIRDGKEKGLFPMAKPPPNRANPETEQQAKPDIVTESIRAHLRLCLSLAECSKTKIDVVKMLYEEIDNGS